MGAWSARSALRSLMYSLRKSHSIRLAIRAEILHQLYQRLFYCDPKRKCCLAFNAVMLLMVVLMLTFLFNVKKKKKSLSWNRPLYIYIYIICYLVNRRIATTSIVVLQNTRKACAVSVEQSERSYVSRESVHSVIQRSIFFEPSTIWPYNKNYAHGTYRWLVLCDWDFKRPWFKSEWWGAYIIFCSFDCIGLSRACQIKTFQVGTFKTRKANHEIKAVTWGTLNWSGALPA